MNASRPRKRRQVQPHRKGIPQAELGKCRKAPDSKHSRDWFEGHTCTWCGAK